MNVLQIFFAAIFAVLVLTLATGAEAADKKAPGTEVIEQGWTKRCPDVEKGKKKQCEIFQRLDVKDASNARVAEFAIGFPETADKKSNGMARGVVVLPLGILLDQGVAMKIDDGKPFVFRARYCTNAGCFSYVNVSKDLLNTLKNGKKITFQFKASEGQDVNLIMSLSGFEKSLKDIL